ncbi:unnamed protein product [Rhizoctonia solani]|uniref:Jacalin-type lectin domain-containing protein n=1 Tax=Rhizoctonia solani TaxID=456999 RepID=A0A8H3CHA7_9AGAM|nr:unnamed protein product [Rhizoctonia solani]
MLPMLDANLKELQIIKNSSILNGVFFDPSAGPIPASRPAAALSTSDTGRVRLIDDSITEDIFSDNEMEVHYSQLGWPCPSKLPAKAWDILTPKKQRTRAEIWGSRRFMVQKMAINLSLQDLCPEEPLVEAVEAALRQRTNALRVRALRDVFTTWGDMIPLNVVIGACMVVSGKLSGEVTMPASGTSSGDPSNDRPKSPPNDHPNIAPNDHLYSLTDIVDQHLGTSKSFTRRFESRVQGGSSEAVLKGGYEAWLKSVIDNPTSWRIIKVNHAVPITEILGSQLRDRVEQLFTSSIITRSPSVGPPHAFGFDGAANGLRTIEKITTWFSASRIRDIAVTYAGGIVAGPYSVGLSDQESQSDDFVLAPGEYVTDMFVWQHLDGWITGVQFAKNNPGLSPMYGINSGESTRSHHPVLLSGNGNALLGISGAYTSVGISQLQAVWRSDVVLRRQRQTQTSCLGSTSGKVFNDLQYLADPATSRIAQISARVKDGVASFKTTYVSISGGALVRSETPPRGSDTGTMSTITFEEGEYIIGVRGHHNGGGAIQRIQFVTNKSKCSI